MSAAPVVLICLATLASMRAVPALADEPSGLRIDAAGAVEPNETPFLWIDDARIREGDAGVSSLVFHVRLQPAVPDTVTVDVAAFDGTATAADLDYAPTSLQLVFAPGSTADSIIVSVSGDTMLEGNEWFRVRLSNPVGAALADSEAIGTIVNDERPLFNHYWVGSTDYRDGTLPSAWADFNGDGYQDLPLFAGGPSHTFTEIPGFRDLLAHGNYHGAAWCDYDRDGDPDLVLVGYDTNGLNDPDDPPPPNPIPPTPNLLLQNQGDGTFVNVAPALGMDIAANAETAVWADFDGDGWPDLFVPYYTFLAPHQNQLFHNNGDGTFTEEAVARGVGLPDVDPHLRPEGAHAADWNDDGHLDLYVASHLYVNDGDGNFTDVRDAVGLPVLFDEGSSLVDYDNDGDLDLYVRGVSSPRLFRNDAGHFTDVSAQAGITDTTLFWGDSWADVDNDGDLDLMQHHQGPSRLMLNQGNGTFVQDSAFSTVNIGRELSAWADVDGDGDLDVVTGAMGKQLLLNHLEALPGALGSHLRVRVLDAEGRETAMGATVRLHELGGPPGTTQTRVVDGGSGYLVQGEYTVHFGVPGAARYALEVVYPSPVGARVVVDSLTNPLLGSIVSGNGTELTYTVYRDGRVERAGQPPAGVGGIESRPGASAVLGLPSPLPARSRVSIPVQMARSAAVALVIHDIGGRLVRRLDPGPWSAGVHAAVWDLADRRGAAVPVGIYFCRLLVDGVPAGMRRLVVSR